MTTPRAALFGKLPTHGDFVSRGLDPAAVDAWDAFFAAGVERAREALGDGFEAAHDVAPPWRFVQGPGIFGPGWRAGAWAPSQDRTGRRFVIAVMADGLEPSVAGKGGEILAEAMEAAIYDTFDAAENADALLGRAQAAIRTSDSLAKAEALPIATRWWTNGGPEHSPDKLTGEPTPDDIVRALRTGTVEVAP